MKSIGLCKFLRTVAYILGIILAFAGILSVNIKLAIGLALFAAGIVLLILGSICADRAKRLKQERELDELAQAKQEQSEDSLVAPSPATEVASSATSASAEASDVQAEQHEPETKSDTEQPTEKTPATTAQ